MKNYIDLVKEYIEARERYLRAVDNLKREKKRRFEDVDKKQYSNLND